MKNFKTVPDIFISLALVAFITHTSLGNSDKKLITTFGIVSSQKMIIPCWYEEAQDMSTFPVGTYPCGVAFDGANIWVANNGSGSVTKLRASDGTALGTYAVGFNPRGVIFDGTNIWVANTNSNSVTKLRASDGTVLGTYAVGWMPEWVAFDGTNIWVADYGSGKVTKLRTYDGTVMGNYTVGFYPIGVALMEPISG